MWTEDQIAEAHEWFELVKQFGDWLDDEEIEAILTS